MPTPIFVLGKHRSGTTWLANQLCEHSLIAGIRHSCHFGVHESAFFSRVEGRYGSLSVWSNYVEFVEVMAASDYFRLAGASRWFLYSLWPTTYEAVFRTVMDRFADRTGARYWLEKSPSHSVLIDHLARLYPDARFVVIKRGLEQVVASSVGSKADLGPDTLMRAEGRKRRILRTALSWVYYYKVLDAFASRTDRMIRVDYETLRADLSGSLERVCAFLELPFEPRLCNAAYIPNSSFQDGAARRQSLTPAERRFARTVASAAQAIPLPVLSAAATADRSGAGRESLPRWFFSLLNTAVDEPSSNNVATALPS